MSILADTIISMYDHELTLGGRAAFQYGLHREVKRKELPIGDFPSFLFYNPGRVRSVMADVSAKTLAERKCFLCPDGLEDKQLTFHWDSPLAADGAEAHRYAIRVNPFPIFAPHYTISSVVHEPQQISGHYEDMLHLCRELPEFTVFYNGPRCGASAPDHMHFQAVPMGSLPMQTYTDEHGHLPEYCPSAELITGDDIVAMIERFEQLVSEYALRKMPPTVEQAQPMCLDKCDFNIISWWNGRYNTVIEFRRQSRPSCFFAEDPEERILISPGAVEMSGVAIVSTEESFAKMTASKLQNIIQEVSLPARK